ncbi:hypothetical protein ASZ90_004523 [hydrocarbon metagenome]|uniref:Uncharacterized protein n=1 Tax=hydrocarbon metagenome TaxID=938273 RepID=A0A0W8FXV9_9ZZZZ
MFLFLPIKYKREKIKSMVKIITGRKPDELSEIKKASETKNITEMKKISTE